MNGTRCETRKAGDVGGLEGAIPPHVRRATARATSAEGQRHAPAATPSPRDGTRAAVFREQVDDPMPHMEPASVPAAGLPAYMPNVETRQAAEDDISAFSRAATPVPPDLARLDGMADEISEFLDTGHTSGQAEITFEFSVPGGGSIEGRIVMEHGHADLELRFMRRSVAEAMRARLPELRQLLDARSDTDVSLFIV